MCAVTIASFLLRKECLCKYCSIQVLSDTQRCREQINWEVEPYSGTVSHGKKAIFAAANDSSSVLKLDSSDHSSLAVGLLNTLVLSNVLVLK